MFPQLCASLGKSVEVDSVTASHSTLYRLSSDKTSEGKLALEKLQQNKYDYVVLQPTRRVSPFEYSVYHAEYEAALKLNKIISQTGAKTLLIASAGINTGEVEVCELLSDGVNSKIIEYLPIDRVTHKKFFENLCNDLVRNMTNAQIIRVGEACEVIMRNLPDYNSLYRSDNRHPSQRGSYVQAACIYSTIFGESTVGAGYIEDLYPYNAVLAQRASDVVVLGESESVLFKETANLSLQSELFSNDTSCVSLQAPESALYYEVYRKQGRSAYAYIGEIVNGQNVYIDTGLVADETYAYRVKGYYCEGELSFSVTQTCDNVLQTLAVPQKPILTLVDRKTIRLDFLEVPTAENYHIYRRIRSLGIYEHIATVTDLYYVDKNLQDGFLYDYKIVASKDDDLVASEYSKKSTIFASKKPKFIVESTRKRTAKITINEVKGANLYVIYYKKHDAEKYRLLTKTSALKYKAKGLVSGEKYDFKIKACINKNLASCTSDFTYKTKKIK